MSIAPNAGIVDLDTFLSPTSSADGQQGQVPKPLAGQENHVLSASGWIPSSSGSGTVTSVSGTGTVNGITLTGTVTTSGNLTLGGALSNVDLTSQVTGTLPIVNGGTGATTAANALTSLGAYPASNPNGYTSNTGTVTSVALTTPTGLTTTGSPISTSGTLGISFTAGYSIPTTSSQTNWDTAYSERLNWDGGSTGLNPTTGRTSLSAAKSGANTDITSIALTSGTITATPSSTNDIVNKSYADSIATGVNFHPACQWATTADLGSVTYSNGISGVGATLTNAGTQVALVIDGHTFTATDVTNSVRVLVKNESNAAYNGVYTVTNQGSVSTNWELTRATDYDSTGSGTNEIDAGDEVLVLSGTTNANTAWVQQTPLPITIGTTGIVFIQFAAVQTYTAGTGLSLITNQFSITNVGTANTYGSASQVPVFTTNAQGQVTSVTNTNIAISGSAVSGDISGNAANVTGTVAIGNGGTGQTTQQAALNAISGAVTNTYYLRGNGTNVSMSAIQASDVPTLNQNTTGTASNITATTNSTLTTLSALSLPGSQVSGNISGNAANVTGTVAIANGGTGATTRQDAMDALAGSTTSGQYLRGNGTDVVMSTIQAADVPTLNQNTTGQAGSVANALTAGTNITFSSGTTYNGSAAITINAASSALAKNTTVVTSGSAATYTAPANTTWVKVTVVGPGGNGGASATGRATGGGGGAVAIKWLSMSAAQTLTYTVGTASGTASSVSSGTLVITTISAGSGSNGTSTAYATSITAGGAGGTATGGDVNITGGQGGYSYGSGSTITTNFSGMGGDCPGFGTGGPALSMIATTGIQGNGYGAGASGSHGNNQVANGRGGIIIFEAY